MPEPLQDAKGETGVHSPGRKATSRRLQTSAVCPAQPCLWTRTCDFSVWATGVGPLVQSRSAPAGALRQDWTQMLGDRVECVPCVKVGGHMAPYEMQSQESQENH